MKKVLVFSIFMLIQGASAHAQHGGGNSVGGGGDGGGALREMTKRYGDFLDCGTIALIKEDAKAQDMNAIIAMGMPEILEKLEGCGF